MKAHAAARLGHRNINNVHIHLYRVAPNRLRFSLNSDMIPFIIIYLEQALHHALKSGDFGKKIIEAN